MQKNSSIVIDNENNKDTNDLPANRPYTEINPPQVPLNISSLSQVKRESAKRLERILTSSRNL